MSRTPLNRTALAGIAILTLVWSLNWVVSKTALHGSGPFTFSALRFIVGTAGLFILLAVLRKPLKPTPWIPTLLIGLTQTAGFQTFAQWSLVSGGAGKMAVLAYSMPFWMIPLAWWVLREKPGAWRWLCISVALLGFIAVVEPWQPLGAAHSIAMALFAGLLWALSAVLTKRAFERYPNMTPLSLTAWQMVVGTVALVVIALAVPERSIHWTAAYVGALLYAGLLASSIAWTAWAVIVRLVPASVAGLTSLTVPVGGVLWAWALLGEAPSPAEWIGIALITTALIALNFPPGKRQKSAPPASRD
ncbi:MAG: EamA family transporter [Nevskiaceae bacterium]|nr:MAG: EamA family transporter [Nevskiaceae bacterium]TBR73990.1 MAG: EamA family transporter [Nevskiaceae bacterium]